MTMYLYSLYDQLLKRQNDHALRDSELVTLAYLLEILHVARRPSIIMPVEDLAEGLGLKEKTLREHIHHLDQVVEWLHLVLSSTHVVIHIWSEYIAEARVIVGNGDSVVAGQDREEAPAPSQRGAENGDFERKSVISGGPPEGSTRPDQNRRESAIFSENQRFLAKNGGFQRPIITGRTVGMVLDPEKRYLFLGITRTDRPTVNVRPSMGEGGV